jgi:hypothetical protein
MNDQLICSRKRGLSPWALLGWGRLLTVPLSFVFSLSLGCSTNSSTVARENQASPTLIVEIIKPQLDTHPYHLTLSSERTINYAGLYLGRVMEKSTQLSPEEFDDVLRLIEECRTSEPVAESFEDRGTTLAQITIFRGGTTLVFGVNDRSNYQVQLFRKLEAMLRLGSMRCPFPITLEGRELDACVYESELLKKIQQERKK